MCAVSGHIVSLICLLVVFLCSTCAGDRVSSHGACFPECLAERCHRGGHERCRLRTMQMIMTRVKELEETPLNTCRWRCIGYGNTQGNIQECMPGREREKKRMVLSFRVRVCTLQPV